MVAVGLLIWGVQNICRVCEILQQQGMKHASISGHEAPVWWQYLVFSSGNLDFLK
jgi:hypothetical protein